MQTELKPIEGRAERHFDIWKPPTYLRIYYVSAPKRKNDRRRTQERKSSVYEVHVYGSGTPVEAYTVVKYRVPSGLFVELPKPSDEFTEVFKAMMEIRSQLNLT